MSVCCSIRCSLLCTELTAWHQNLKKRIEKCIWFWCCYCYCFVVLFPIRAALIHFALRSVCVHRIFHSSNMIISLMFYNNDNDHFLSFFFHESTTTTTTKKKQQERKITNAELKISFCDKTENIKERRVKERKRVAWTISARNDMEIGSRVRITFTILRFVIESFVYKTWEIRMYANQIGNASGNERNNENSNTRKWGKVKERRRRNQTMYWKKSELNFAFGLCV